ncbi:hypothetical protein HG530_013092 [Fusarium avenaceum]|nr:hypothetical protein HG530_013092 [Fusarium avenaceum]
MPPAFPPSPIIFGHSLHHRSIMSWDRYELGQKNIFYDETRRLFPDKVLPSHVERVRQLTLDFSCALRGSSYTSHHSLQDLLDGHDAEPALKAAQKAQREAVNIIDGGFMEEKWASFFEKHFFAALSDSLSDNDNGLGPFESVKRPKPDHAFFLPIYHSENKSGIPTISDPDARQWNEVWGPLGREPFSWLTLKRLNEFGLQPTPRRIFNQQPREADLKCYPWFVIEHKKENESERNVSCQAANGAACAVSLVQHSAQYAVKLLDQAHVPPIPAMTTIGSQVTIWLMYYAKDFDAPCTRRSSNEVTTKRRKEGHIMHAVWNGDMTKLTDAFELQMILDNVHTWAMRVFKPLIATYIEQWNYVHCHPSFDLNTQALLAQSKSNRDRTIEQRRAILPIIQDILEDHATMELDELSHQKLTPLLLGLFMHQICSSEREFIAKEVDRAVEDKFKLLSINEPQETRGSASNQSHNADASQSIRRLLNSLPAASTSRSSSPTPVPPVDDDDPNDSDYRDSQDPPSATNQVNDALAETSDAESSVAEFAEHSPTVWSAFQDPATPRATPYQSPIPKRPKANGRNSSSNSPGVTSGSAENTPRPDIRSGQFTFSTAPKSPASPLGSQRQRSLTARTPSGSPVFAGRSPPGRPSWSSGQRFGEPRPSKSPIPRQFQHVSDQESQIQSEGGENNYYIDLTRDSQDEIAVPETSS